MWPHVPVAGLPTVVRVVWWWSMLVAVTVCSQNFGPAVQMTRGEVWPRPAVQHKCDERLAVEPKNFHFNVIGYSCDNLQSALKMYNGMLFMKATKLAVKRRRPKNPVVTVDGRLEVLNVHLTNACEDYPSLDMDEKYEIKINGSGGTLLAPSIWGILRGLETFSQLVALDEDGSTFIVRCTSITDYPKFKHRGYLLDTSRHYFPIKTIMRMLDAMAYSKLNVFHWHIVDDNSFPFQSSTFPNLSEKGAFGYSAIYTRNSIKFVIEYAKLRGIRVIPEFDTPGHTLSWAPGGIPGLLTNCSDSESNKFGPIDPTSEENYKFISTLFTEVSELFKDEYLHVGGDEVELSIDCWSKNKEIQKFMRRNNIDNTTELEKYYFKNIFDITRRLKTTPIVWQELFDINTQLDSNVVVQVWKGDFNVTVRKVLESGHPVVLSSCWYLNYGTYGADWRTYYGCDPSEAADGPAHDLLLGGEACMWAEYADETNVLQQSWPQASAVAEVLWSGVGNATEAAARLEEHVCRMRRRGVPAEPANGPGYCDY